MGNEKFLNKIDRLQKENDELKSSLDEINKLVNAVHIAIVLQCSEKSEVRVPPFSVDKINEEYLLATHKDEDTGEYVMKVAKREKEAE